MLFYNIFKLNYIILKTNLLRIQYNALHCISVLPENYKHTQM